MPRGVEVAPLGPPQTRVKPTARPSLPYRRRPHSETVNLGFVQERSAGGGAGSHGHLRNRCVMTASPGGCGGAVLAPPRCTM